MDFFSTSQFRETNQHSPIMLCVLVVRMSAENSGGSSLGRIEPKMLTIVLAFASVFRADKGKPRKHEWSAWCQCNISLGLVSSA